MTPGVFYCPSECTLMDGAAAKPTLPLPLPPPFVVLVTGSRGWTNAEAIERALIDATKGHSHVRLVHGGAKGADQLAHKVAVKRGWQYKVYTPDWHKLGRSAGLTRNSDMITQEKRVDLVLAFPTNDSRGTWDMVAKAKRAGLCVQIDRTELTD